ncbi:MAG: methyltransferase domain-containing protein [Candidatus Moranbacteria bacterium]|nr:methyltransferase domain-containing protein [Candidatus Moranbacteria bacterium]
MNRIAFCQKQHSTAKNLDFFQADGADLSRFPAKTFDVVIMNMVVLNIPSLIKIKKVFKETARVLKAKGQFIFSNLNPLCIMIKKTACETQTHLKDFSYFQDGSKYRSQVRLSDNSQMEFVDVHWTLESLTGAASSAGFYLKRIIEPRPIKNPPKCLVNYTIAEHIIFDYQKINS